MTQTGAVAPPPDRVLGTVNQACDPLTASVRLTSHVPSPAMAALLADANAQRRGGPPGPGQPPIGGVKGLGPPPAPEAAVHAPYPSIDRYPVLVGSNLTLTYLSSVFRLALTGYRREYVDLLGEILERDPHLFAVVNQRILTVAGARIHIAPADPRSKRCIKIAEECERRIHAMADFRQSFATLLFSAYYYGVGASEIAWERSGQSWIPRRLHFIHSRRLNYPDPSAWDLRIWDQGAVYPLEIGQPGRGGASGAVTPGMEPSSRLFGIRVSDYPGKFLVLTPQLRADYPTREGLGRELAIWSALKAMGARSAAQFVERFAKPWAFISYKTMDGKDGERAALAEDIAQANAVLASLGTGSMAGAVIPDSLAVKIEQIMGRGTLTYEQWIKICNSEMSKGALGQTETTEGSSTGGYARAKVMKTGADQLARHDAECGASALRDLCYWMVRLNWPKDIERVPIVKVIVEPDPDPSNILDNAVKAATCGAPVDADAVCGQAGVPLAAKNARDARIMMPLSPVDANRLYPQGYMAALAPPGDSGGLVKPEPPAGLAPGGADETNDDTAGAQDASSPPADQDEADADDTDDDESTD